MGEGNGNPLQYSCLENPVDRGAWWAVVHGVAKSQTRLKQFSSSSSNGETGIENRHMDMGRAEDRVRCMERVKRILIIQCVK